MLFYSTRGKGTQPFDVSFMGMGLFVSLTLCWHIWGHARTYII